MSPVLPHFVAECLDQLNQEKIYIWPSINKKYVIKKITKIVFQVNGKKKDIIQFNGETISEKEILDKIKSDKNYDKFLLNKKIIKTIYVKNRLINLIIK